MASSSGNSSAGITPSLEQASHQQCSAWACPAYSQQQAQAGRLPASQMPSRGRGRQRIAPHCETPASLHGPRSIGMLLKIHELG